jgi:hypothetical protein
MDMIERDQLIPGTRFKTVKSALGAEETLDTIFVVVNNREPLGDRWIPAVREKDFRTTDDISTHLFLTKEVAEIVPFVIDEEMAKFLDGVVGVVECDNYGHHMLWIENHYKATELEHRKLDWKSDQMGMMEKVGEIAGMPVCISLFKAVIDGQPILFVDPCSMVVDHRLIDAWYKRALPKSAFRADGYVNKTDAMNFHNVLRG